MVGSADFSTPAHLIAEPARSAMLAALLGGRALPAGELAYAAGITAQTASSHLAKLLDGGLLSVETEGRHRYYRLAGPHVAEALERLATIGNVPPRRKALTREAQALRFCRSCYDHLAGQVGVALTDALLERGFICAANDKQFVVTPAGSEWFVRQGLDVTTLHPTPRGLARQCLDWTERRHHLAGPLGVGLLETFCRNRWLVRGKASRKVTVTPLGWSRLASELGIRQTDMLAPLSEGPRGSGGDR